MRRGCGGQRSRIVCASSRVVIATARGDLDGIRTDRLLRRRDLGAAVERESRRDLKAAETRRLRQGFGEVSP